jgi:hypothetical protein
MPVYLLPSTQPAFGGNPSQIDPYSRGEVEDWFDNLANKE